MSVEGGDSFSVAVGVGSVKSLEIHVGLWNIVDNREVVHNGTIICTTTRRRHTLPYTYLCLSRHGGVYCSTVEAWTRTRKIII